jgi:hypothetical protein
MMRTSDPPHEKVAVMFGDYSAKEILMWIGGMVVAAMIVIFGVIMVVDMYLAFQDPSDPMEQRRGLTREQEAGETK